MSENSVNTTDPNAYIIELVEVTKRYKDVVALERVNLDIGDGEFLVLLGPSGCGKSTLLKIIAGLEDATEGEIYINGRLVNYVAPKERDVSMVFQNYALYPHMTAERNIGFPLEMNRVDKNETRSRVVDIAQMLEIEDLLGKYPDQMSGGQRQRVALGRAIIRNPVAYLLDEPLSNLDAILRIQMRDELIQLRKRLNKTIVHVTHDQIEAMTMADRIVILKLGVIQQIGNPSEVYRRPANTFVATFVGSPPMNLFKGRLEESSDGFDFVGPFRQSLGRHFPKAEVGADVSLGIRSEDISIVGTSVSNGLQGNVVFIEPLGSDTFLSLNIAEGVSVKARVPASLHVEDGEQLAFKFSSEDANLFDSDGLRIPSVDEI
jgi:ABC-type sugar transport system ATPase subunit